MMTRLLFKVVIRLMYDGLLKVQEVGCRGQVTVQCDQM